MMKHQLNATTNETLYKNWNVQISIQIQPTIKFKFIINIYKKNCIKTHQTGTDITSFPLKIFLTHIISLRNKKNGIID